MLLYLQADVSSAHGKFLNGDSINGQILKKVFKILPLNQELVSFHLQIMNQANTVCPDIVMFQNFFFFWWARYLRSLFSLHAKFYFLIKSGENL